jgi:uncharacterized protein (DUF885 family)
MPTRRTVLASAAALVATRARAADYAQALSAAYGGPVDLRAAQILALTEASRLLLRADRLMRLEGLRGGDVVGALRTLAADPRWLYPDDDVGRARAVAEMNTRLAKLRPRLAAAFGDLAIPQPEVRRPAPENEARGGYREPPVYYVDLRNIRSRPAWTLPTVAFHETVPGHALQASVTGRPRPGSFSEAWAIYAEQLARDLGAYAGDGRGELGYIQWRLFRMARLLADIGQGAQGWSLDQAVANMRKVQGFDAAFVTIEADAARIRAQPGQYAAQALGALVIARARPGPGARWPAFHRAILADGPWPCSMLAAGTGAAQ